MSATEVDIAVQEARIVPKVSNATLLIRGYRCCHLARRVSMTRIDALMQASFQASLDEEEEEKGELNQLGSCKKTVS